MFLFLSFVLRSRLKQSVTEYSSSMIYYKYLGFVVIIILLNMMRVMLVVTLACKRRTHDLLSFLEI